MHCPVGNDNKGARECSETNNILPQSQVVEAKRAKDRGSRYFYIKTVFVINQCQKGCFVNNQGFEAIMEDR